MIINSIEMEYFFRIYKSKKLEFAIEDDKNITVIKGDNGTGKTTMLCAFSWVFYGEVEMPLVIEQMLNKKRLSEITIGDLETASVKVNISDCNHTYIISRSQKFKKTDEHHAVKIGDEDLIITDAATPQIQINDNRFFESIIPKDLRGFFFFDGERIDRLAKIDGRDEIKDAILNILGLNTLEKINDVICELQKDYNKEVKKATTSAEVQTLTQAYDEISESISNISSGLNSTIKMRKDAEKEIEKCRKYLKEHNAEAIKALQIERDGLDKEKLNLQNELVRRKQEVLKHISRNFKYYLLADYIPKISDFLEEKRKKRELPSDIKEQFVRDLLSEHECICGQKLIEGELFYKNIEKLLETAGKEELDNAYITMRAFIDSNEIKENISKFYPIIYEYKNWVSEEEIQNDSIDVRLKDISKKLLNNFGQIISGYEDTLEKAEDTKIDLLGKENLYKLQMNEENAKIKTIEAKLKLAKGKESNKNMFSDAFDMASELKKMNDDIREFFIRITREDMDKKIKTVFEQIARKEDREACLNENFELTIQNKTSHQQQILSQGERQITSLAFIGALVSYAKEKVNSDMITDFCGGDFPIVMDSPFGNLDNTHKANVAKGLPLLASQVVVIVSEEQWSGIVEENMVERVANVYAMADGQYDGNDNEYTEFVRCE